jgi:hypothetical protein
MVREGELVADAAKARDLAVTAQRRVARAAGLPTAGEVMR